MFNVNGFTRGEWTDNVRTFLPADLIPGWRPVIRLVRATWDRWIQYEPREVPGPKFWLAKPAILALDNALPNGAALCTGLYVERGYDENESPPGSNALEVMDGNWHWHRLMNVWGTSGGRELFHSCLVGSGEPLAVIRHSRGRDFQVIGAIPLTRPETYLELGAMLDGIPRTRWIDLVIGVAAPLARCLAAPNEVVDESRGALIRAIELQAVVAP